MSQTFVFEELDAVTRDYLVAVRDANGDGAPGVFAPTTSSMAGCGCIAGPIIIIATLVATLTDMVNVVYKDPTRMAMLQTAGLLLGGWLLLAAFRSSGSKGSKTTAGHWVYVDALHLFQAYREQVTVTKIDDIVESNFTHNYNNGSYQNSVVRVVLDGGRTVSVTVNNEGRAEQMVVYLNYLAYARGPEGGERGKLAPASLGGLAKYVSENDSEPKDHENNINLNLIEVDIAEVPEEPTREGRAAPAFMPYVVMLVAGVGIFFLMKTVVNPPIRDDAIYEAVIKEPCEPWFLQVYLLDDRNTRHRVEVQAKLGSIYDEAVRRVEQNQPGQKQPDLALRSGMGKILRSLKETVRPVVSLKVSEQNAKAGADKRVEKLRDELVGKVEGRKVDPNGADVDWFEATGGIVGEMARIMPAVQPPAGVTFPTPRTAVGIQLIDFAEKPEDAQHAHFEVVYEFVPAAAGKFTLKVDVQIRTDLEGAPVAIYSEEDPKRQFTAADFDRELTALKDRLVRGLVGTANNAGGMPIGQGINPNVNIP